MTWTDTLKWSTYTTCSRNHDTQVSTRFLLFFSVCTFPRDWVQQALTCQPAPSPATHGWPDEATDKTQKPCRENVAISPSNARLIISLHYLAPFGRMDRRGVQVRPSTAPRSLLKNPPPRVSERGGGWWLIARGNDNRPRNHWDNNP